MAGPLRFRWVIWTCLLAFEATASASSVGQLVEVPAERGSALERPSNISEFLALGSRTRVIAHRGFSAVAPENTLASVTRAIEIGADMAEIDVLLSKDGAVVVIHDATLDRTTNGRGKVADQDLGELKTLDAGSWFSEEFADERIPTLGEALDLIDRRILLNIEIKTEAVTEHARGGIEERILELVRERDLGDQVIISSFDPRALAHTRQLDAEIKTASLFNQKLHNGQGPLEVTSVVGSNGFNLSAGLIDSEIIEEAHHAGLPVAIYTVNSHRDLQRAVDSGVAAIFTNYPDRLLEILRDSGL